jgi:hypothetical protein
VVYDHRPLFSMRNCSDMSVKPSLFKRGHWDLQLCDGALLYNATALCFIIRVQ